MRLIVPGFRLDRWRLRAHWEATLARDYVERVLGRELTETEFYIFSRPIRAQHVPEAA